MDVSIQLTLANPNTGPFNLYSNLDAFTAPFATAISRSTLLAGYTSTVVPNSTSIIRVKSTGVCQNYIDITINIPVTTTTTTTASSPITTTTTTTSSSPVTTTTTTTATIPLNTFNVTNNGFENYVVNGSSNPTITLVEGQTYTFNISAPGHPFWIKTTPVIGTGSAYNDGVTNNGVDNGTITFTVPFDAPSTLYYICQFHSSMQGIINIIDVPQPTTTTTTTTSTPVTTTTTTTSYVEPGPTVENETFFTLN